MDQLTSLDHGLLQYLMVGATVASDSSADLIESLRAER